MHNKDLVFAGSLALALFVFAFFFGDSLTGSVVQSMYCTDEGCFEFCNSQYDCLEGYVCCERFGRGVCAELCEFEFLLAPQPLESMPPILEQPRQTFVGFYLASIFLVVMIGVLYLHLRRNS